MPSVGNISFSISCIDEASAVIKKANNLFSNFRNNVMQSSSEVVKSYDLQSDAMTKFSNVVDSSSSKTFGNSNRFREFGQQNTAIKSNIASLDSLSDTFETIDTASNNFVAKLWIVNYALKSLADYAQESLVVAQNAEIANLRLTWMADALYYGADASNEAKVAFQGFASSLSSTGLSEITKLSQMGYDVNVLADSYTNLDHSAKIAGVSLSEMMNDLGGSYTDLSKYGISETIFNANTAAILAKRIQNDYRLATQKVLSYDVALAQARMQIYSTEIAEYSDNWDEFTSTAAGAAVHFQTISNKFMAALGRVYNVGLAPILNILGSIMDVISSSPIAAAIAGITLAGSAIAVLSVTILPQFINTMSKTVSGVMSFVGAMGGLIKSFNAQAISNIVNTITQLDQNRIALVLNQAAIFKNTIARSKNAIITDVNTASNVNLTASELALSSALSKNSFALIIANAQLFKNNVLKTIASLKSKSNINAMLSEGIAVRLYGDQVKYSTWQLLRANIADKASVGLLKAKVAATGLNIKSMFSLTRVMSLFKNGGGAIASVLGLLKTGFLSLIPTVISFGASAFAAIIPLLPIILPIVAAIGLIIAAFIALKTAYETNFGGFANLINGIGDIFRNVFDGIVSFLQTLWGTIIKPIQEAFASVFAMFSDGGEQLGFFDIVLQSIQNVITVISTIAGPFLEFIKGTLMLIGKIIGSSIALPIKLIGKLFQPFSKMFSNFGNAADDLKQNPVFKFLSDTFGGWSENIGKFFDILMIGVDVLSEDVYNGVISFFDDLSKSPVVTFIVKIIDTIELFKKAIIEGIFYYINLLYNTIINIFDSLMKHPVFVYISNSIKAFIYLLKSVKGIFDDFMNTPVSAMSNRVRVQQTSFVTNNVVKTAAQVSDTTDRAYGAFGNENGNVSLGDMNIIINADGLDSAAAEAMVESKLQTFGEVIAKKVSASTHSSFGSSLI